MRDAYIVTYQNGASGAFISGLIYLYLAPRPCPLTYSQYGDAHENEIYRENWNRTDSEVYSHRVLRILEPKFKQMPFVVRGHREFERDKAVQKFPNYCNIRITTTPDDFELISAFVFFKIILRNYNNLDPGPWARLSKGSYTDPNTLNQEDLKYYIKLLEKKFVNKSFYWGEENFDANLFPDNEYVLKFSDIIFNRDKVLNFLSKITENPTIPIIEQSYKNYINANKNIINYKCPWINF